MNVPKIKAMDFGSNCRLRVSVCDRFVFVSDFYVYFSLFLSAYYFWWICLLIWLLPSFFFSLIVFLFYFIFSLPFFLPFLLSRVADRVLVVHPGVRPEPLWWES